MLGWALSAQGRGEDGLLHLRHGLSIYRATGSRVFEPYFSTLWAEGYARERQPGEGLTAVAEAVDRIGKTGERWYEAEIYRLKGELTLEQSGVRSPASGVKKQLTSKVQGLRSKVPSTQHPTPSTQAEAQEAEGYFLKAIDVARQQQAKSLELRVTVSLARLWRQQGKAREAHRMLVEVYGWFTEGFDTKDLQEAKALLQELAEG